MRKVNVVAHAVDELVGKRIRHRRWALGVTQAELGEKIGVKFQQVQKYELGINRISASRLWEVSRALDVPISFFFISNNSLNSKSVESSDPTSFPRAG